MSLTADQVTAGTYTVRFTYGELSAKRFRDAVALIKGIGGLRDEFVYDPQNPAASSVTGYAPNDCPDSATAEYDPAARTWTVTIPRNGRTAASGLAAAARAYGAAVERA